MVKIAFDNDYINVCGHTKNIVCAGVSAIIMGAINWFNEKDILLVSDQEKGLISLTLINKSKSNQEKLKLVLIQLKALELNYNKYIEFKRGK